MSTSSVTTRLLGPNDASVLSNVADDVFDNPVCPDLAAQFLNERHNLLAVALADTRVVGMASAFIYLHPDKLPQLFVNEVGVAAQYQRQGIAKRLLCLVLEGGRRAGCTEAWVATEEDNVAARGLYIAASGVEEPDRAVVYTYRLSTSVGERDRDSENA